MIGLRSRTAPRLAALAAVAALLCACSDGGNGGNTDGGLDGTARTDGSTTSDSGNVGQDGNPVGFDVPITSDGPIQVSDSGVVVQDPDGGTWVCHPITCAGHQVACGDCTDNDGDGLIDAHDPDCIGPCSNSESNLFGSVGGSSASACNLNCYFDFGQGGGTGCTWDHECDPLAPVQGCPYIPPDQRTPGLSGKCPDQQTSFCHDECEPLTPNGCDCFGCCEFHSQFLYLGTRDNAGVPTCTIEAARAGDTTACHPCTPVRDPTTNEFSCGNSCGACEYCIDGHVPEPSCYTSTPPDSGTLPQDAGTPPQDAGTPPPSDGGTNTMQCPTGVNPCGPNDTCPVDYYCITGCCQYVPP